LILGGRLDNEGIFGACIVAAAAVVFSKGKEVTDADIERVMDLAERMYNVAPKWIAPGARR